jgi:hypothetical protein
MFAHARASIRSPQIPLFLSLIFGLILQLLNMFILWILYMIIGKVEVSLSIILFTFIEVIILATLIYKYIFKSKHALHRVRFSLDWTLIVISFIYFTLAAYWQQFATEPHSDGAAYLDLARNIVKNGVFSSSMVFPSGSWNSVLYNIGFNLGIHSIGYCIFAIFFILGDISLQTAQIALIFQGFLIILILYELTKKLFGTITARIAALVAAIHPEMINHVVLVGGSEISSALFILFSIYLLLLSAEELKNRIKYGILSGISLFLAWFSWYFNFLVFLTQLPIIYLYIAITNKKSVKKTILDLFIISMATSLLVIDWRVFGILSYAFLGIEIPVSAVVLLPLIVITRAKFSQELKVFLVLILTISIFFSIHRIVFDSSPLLKIHAETFGGPQQLAMKNINRDTNILLSRIINWNEMFNFLNIYYGGIKQYYGSIFLFLVIMSLVRVEDFSKILLISSFPLLEILWWIFVVPLEYVNIFQPRYVVCSFLFDSILLASAVEYLILGNSHCVSLSAIFKFFDKKIILYLSKDILIPIFRFILIIILLISAFSSTYFEHKKVLDFWKFSEKYSWTPAIEWIKNSLPKNVTLLTSSPSYLAWYTERHVAYLGVGAHGTQPTDKLTERELIELIKIYKANYLVIDGRTAWSYPFISSLLNNPHEFLGAKVIFNNGRVVIYNVSNIAYNVPHLLTSTTLNEVESLEQWYANVGYGNATLQLDSENKINGNFSIKYVQTVTNTVLPQSCLFLRLSRSTNLSNYDYLVFYIKTLQESKITVALITDSYNYFLSPKYTIVGSNFTQVNVSIKILKSIGNPNLENISKIQICFTDLVPGRTYTNWIDGPLIAEKIVYELINP